MMINPTLTQILRLTRLQAKVPIAPFYPRNPLHPKISAGAVCYCDMRYAVYHALWYEFFKKIPQKSSTPVLLTCTQFCIRVGSDETKSQ